MKIIRETDRLIRLSRMGLTNCFFVVEMDNAIEFAFRQCRKVLN